jgi:hypothetical protein
MFISLSAFGQSVALPPVNFQVNADHALSKFEDAILHPEDVLQRFRPAGVRVSNKHVAQNEISFVATKTVLLVTKSIYVHGVFESREFNRGCSGNEKSFLLRMHFESSHWVVTDNVQELRAIVCLRENSNTNISGQVRAQIIKGRKYSNTFGPIAISLIKDQVNPLLTALTEEIRSMR